MDVFEDLFHRIKADPENIRFTNNNIDPLYYAAPTAKLLIIGQAPGEIAQNTKIIWNDRSGVRLREWMGVSDDTFYHSGKIAVLPMDFYFPGKGKSGDLPPRKGFAAKWHDPLIRAMPGIELTLLVGAYAQKYYLKAHSKMTLTEMVKNYRDYLPSYFPLVHPSPRNSIWIKRNPWFEDGVLPDLKKLINRILS
ncbi:uracil-DNA glycosylase family protein [Sporolactobacillus vineae]|jgi:uracil-DNA glycosylase|uniref:uracil-DNA glycosylase family protein n=1 Tax=Sporolactobacillus vineae TaxID=444463 RepID=UPI00028A1828|nr:uracil-DNA glycosylase family protein [Sporolactobacillus vineae]